MNASYYVGDKISSFERYNDIGPITGVTILVNADTEYQAGDSRGYVLTLQCSFGTQEMANAILISLYQKVYKGFRASGVELPPEAELGDAITVNGLYSFIAYRNVTFGPGHMSEIAAPGDNELGHEFQYTGSTRKEYSSDIDSVRAFVQKALGEIQIELNSVKTSIQQLTQTVSDISNKVTELDSRVKKLEGGS